jgi:hypothetical protein
MLYKREDSAKGKVPEFQLRLRRLNVEWHLGPGPNVMSIQPTFKDTTRPWYRPAQMYRSQPQYSIILNLLNSSDELFAQLRPFQVRLGPLGSTGMEDVKVRIGLSILLYINLQHKLCRMFQSDLGLIMHNVLKKHYCTVPVTIRPSLNFFRNRRNLRSVYGTT